MSFAKKIGKNLSNKYSQKLIDAAKTSTTDVVKTASKKAIQKTAEATGDLIGNKVAVKITSVSKNSKKLPEKDVEIITHKKDTYLQKKDNKLLMN